MAPTYKDNKGTTKDRRSIAAMPVARIAGLRAKVKSPKPTPVAATPEDIQANSKERLKTDLAVLPPAPVAPPPTAPIQDLSKTNRVPEVSKVEPVFNKEVRKLQEALRAEGHNIEATGVYDEKTKVAYQQRADRKYQEAFVSSVQEFEGNQKQADQAVATAKKLKDDAITASKRLLALADAIDKKASARGKATKLFNPKDPLWSYVSVQDFSHPEAAKQAHAQAKRLRQQVKEGEGYDAGLIKFLRDVEGDYGKVVSQTVKKGEKSKSLLQRATTGPGLGLLTSGINNTIDVLAGGALQRKMAGETKKPDYLGAGWKGVENVLTAAPRAFAAGTLAAKEGAGQADRFKAAFGGLTGIHVGDDEVDDFINRTWTFKKREEEVKKGNISSFGESVTGQRGLQEKRRIEAMFPNKKAAAQALKNMGWKDESNPIARKFSGPSDLAFSFIDPTLVAGKLTHGIDKVFDVAATKATKMSAERILKEATNLGLEKALEESSENFVRRIARAAVLDASPVGREVQRTIKKTLESGTFQDPLALKKALNLSTPVAADTLKALADDGIDAATTVLREAITSGTWSPRVAGLNRLAANLGVNAATQGIASKIPGAVGRAAGKLAVDLPLQQSVLGRVAGATLTKLQKWARDSGVSRSIADSSDPMKVVTDAIESALLRPGIAPADFKAQLMAQVRSAGEDQSVSIAQQVDNILAAVDASGNESLSELVQTYLEKAARPLKVTQPRLVSPEGAGLKLPSDKAEDEASRRIGRTRKSAQAYLDEADRRAPYINDAWTTDDEIARGVGMSPGQQKLGLETPGEVKQPKLGLRAPQSAEQLEAAAYSRGEAAWDELSEGTKKLIEDQTSPLEKIVSKGYGPSSPLEIYKQGDRIAVTYAKESAKKVVASPEAVEQLGLALLDNNRDALRTLMHLPAEASDFEVSYGLKAIAEARPKFIEDINTLRTGVAILDGHAGAQARSQFIADITAYVPKRLTVNGLFESLREQGVSPTKKTQFAVDATEDSIRTALGAIPDDLRPRFTNALTDAVGNKTKLEKLATQTGRLLGDSAALGEAVSIVSRDARAVADNIAGSIVKRPGLTRRVFGEFILSIAEQTPPPHISLNPYENPAQSAAARTLVVDKYVTSLGIDTHTASLLKRRAAEVTTEEDLYKLVQDMVKQYSRVHGHDADLLEALLSAHRADYKFGRTGNPMVTGVDQSTGDIIKGVQLPSQLGENVPLPSKEKLVQLIREEIAKTPGLRGAVYQARVNITKAGDLGITIGTKTHTIKGTALSIHKLWKFMVVSNAYMPLIGAVGGVQSGLNEDGSLWEKVLTGAKGFGAGVAIGSLGGTRYIARLGMEQKLRMFMEKGFTSKAWTNETADFALRNGFDRPFTSYDAIMTHGSAKSFMENKVFTASRPGWEVLEKGDARYIDAWYRRLNYQIHPESDMVTAKLLELQAGAVSEEAAQKWFASFMQSEDGKLWYNRFKGGFKGPKSSSEAWTRAKGAVESAAPTPELASRRLEGILSHDDLKLLKKDGPEFVNAQKTWVIPKSISEAWQSFTTVMSRYTFGITHDTLGRVPIARWAYNDEYTRLVRNGVDDVVAHRIADEHAVEVADRLFMNMNDSSRFANKMDFVTPFQQPREEVIRTWGSLVVNHPQRAFRLGVYGARTFNNGKESGMFTKDPVTGEYSMTIPGSGWLANKLYGTHTDLSFDLKGLLFVGQGAYGVGVIPSFGGPYWAGISSMVVKAHPNLYNELPEGMRELLFPFGVNGRLFRSESSRLWMGLTGSTPPWELFDKEQQQDTLNKWNVEIARELYREHVKKTGDASWWPSDKEVKDATKGFFKVWAFYGAITPSAPHAVMPGREDFNAARNLETLGGTIPFDIGSFQEKYPELAPYMTSGGEYVGPDDLKHWSRSEEEKTNDRILHYQKKIPIEEFAEDFKQALKDGKAYKERTNIYDMPAGEEKTAALDKWAEEHPDLQEKTNDKYFRDKELADILGNFPKHRRDAAIDAWRRRYKVSHRTYLELKDKSKYFITKPWTEARDADTLVDEYGKSYARNGTSEEDFARELSPAEQVRFWQERVQSLDYETGTDPKVIMDKYKLYKKYIRDTWKQNPQLKSPTEDKDSYKAVVQKWREDGYKTTTDLYTQMNGVTEEITSIKAAKKAAYEAKNWTAHKALKAKEKALYSIKDALSGQIRDAKNSQSDSQIDFTEWWSEVRASQLFEKKGKHTEAAAARQRAAMSISDENATYLPSNEEKQYLDMPDEVKQAYVHRLVEQLNAPEFMTKAQRDKAGASTHIYWDWLTVTQQRILEMNMDASQVQAWKESRPQPYNPANFKPDPGVGELGFADEMMSTYNKRNGMEAPDAYTEYLEMPQNSAVRREFLLAHPEVREYIRLGPMANMPIVYRNIVANIMIKHGKWEGKELGVEEMADMSFAQQQIETWNKRPEGALAPGTYDLWRNMPSGPGKAEYLKAHPEVQDWIKLGPMANMPDEYQDVVRDIMTKYGVWTQDVNDPLGATMNEYFKVPSYARAGFLRDHPELTAYWALLSTPQEREIKSKLDNYFSIDDYGMRKAYLESNPEVQDYLIDARSKRYERFMNKVAQFMGANPEMFEQYMSRQNDILAELLRRFAEAPLLSEGVQRLKAAPTSQRGSIRSGSQ